MSQSGPPRTGPHQIEQEIGFMFCIYKGYGSAAPGDPYIARFLDDYGNMKTIQANLGVICGK